MIVIKFTEKNPLAKETYLLNNLLNINITGFKNE